ncbi:hypothetical protein M0P98_06775 [bacterium]|jgi:hypothetical protein|nr:hypothetical protein [bacterium]
MDNIRVTPVFIVKKYFFVIRRRFFYKKRFRVSEVVLFFPDNLWRVIPKKRIKKVYYFFDKLIDRLLWL